MSPGAPCLCLGAEGECWPDLPVCGGSTVCVLCPRFPLFSRLCMTTLKGPEPVIWVGNEPVKISGSSPCLRGDAEDPGAGGYFSIVQGITASE